MEKRESRNSGFLGNRNENKFNGGGRETLSIEMENIR